MALTRSVVRDQTSSIALQQEFNTVGRSSTLEVRPSIVHFSGFSLHVPIKQVVRVVNIGDASTRVHIIPPTSPHFKIKYEKKGLIAPGMSEELTVIFTPPSFRYFYDCIRVHSEGGNLLIPLHGYPTMGKLDFPRSIDIGPCNVGSSVQKIIQLTCSIPIQFEFEFNILEAHPQIRIEPLKGVIPANGHIDIEITFSPIRKATAFSKVQINTSQFNFDPFISTISGVVGQEEGMKQDALLRSSQSLEQLFPENLLLIETDTNLNVQGERDLLKKMAVTRIASIDSSTAAELLPFDTHAKTVPNIPIKAVVGSFDAAAEYLSLLATSPKKRKKHQERTPTLVPETEIEGIKIPKNINSVSALNYVLTQFPGKLKPKDLKIAIAKQRSIREEQKRIQTALASSNNSDGRTVQSLIDEEKKGTIAGSTRQLRELAFLQEIHDIDSQEKRREFASKEDFIGSDLMSQEEVEAVREMRKKVVADEELKTRNLDRTTWALRSFGATSTPPVRAIHEAGYNPSSQVTFDHYKNDLWRKRSQVLLRFIHAASKVIIRWRVATRLQKLKARMGNASTRSQIKAFVEMENRMAGFSSGASGNSKDHGPKAAISIDENIQFVTFPEWSESEATVRVPFPTETPRKFDDLAMMQLKSHPEYSLVGHKEIPLPPFQYYISLEKDRSLRAGAFEEEGIRAERGEDLELFPPRIEEEEDNKEQSLGLEKAAPWLLEPPLVDSEQFILPDNSIRLFSEQVQYEENQLDYDLRPRIRQREVDLPLGSILKETTGFGAVCSITSPTLSQLWQPRNTNLEESPFVSLQTSAMYQMPNHLPPKLSGPLEEDQLSDIESDGEGVTGKEARKPDSLPPPSKKNDSIVSTENYIPLLDKDKYLDVLESGRRQSKEDATLTITNKIRAQNDIILDPRLKFAPLYHEKQ